MALNPLNNNILAVGCRNKWIRLYDRRTLTVGNGETAKPYILLTQHSLLHKQNVMSLFYILALSLTDVIK